MTVYNSGIGHENLHDLIAGVTPTLVDWTNDPTDAADITDGDITTFCTTGNKVAAGAYQYAYFEWNLGAFYNVLCSGVGGCAVSAGSRVTYIRLWNGVSWIIGNTHASSSGTAVFTSVGGLASKIRFDIGSSLAATITPNIREFHVWRL